mmetsp:Transcript_18857/g.46815  ORF Transcript_18857/g.46815 Transcript_18857/m.46815 type:complete len:93 (-) Transcript_18857:767-1045(-)
MLLAQTDRGRDLIRTLVHSSQKRKRDSKRADVSLFAEVSFTPPFGTTMVTHTGADGNSEQSSVATLPQSICFILIVIPPFEAVYYSLSLRHC